MQGKSVLIGDFQAVIDGRILLLLLKFSFDIMHANLEML